MQDQWQVTLPVVGGALRPWRMADAAAYVAARDEEVLRWTTERRDLTVAATEAAIRRVNGSDDVISWAIMGQAGDAPLGNIALVYDRAGQCAEVMYFLAPTGRGRGLATGAVVAVCGWAFANLGVTRILLKTRPGNVRSQRVAIRAGFMPTHVAAPYSITDNEPNDTDEQAVWFELTRTAPQISTE